MKSSNASQSDNRHSDRRLQRLDREISEILKLIEREDVPQNLTKLAEQLQAALRRKGRFG